MRNSEGSTDVAAAVAEDFLRAFWRGDVDAAVSLCSPAATFTFARSLPYPRVCAIREGLTLIVEGLFSEFDPPGRFDVDLKHVVSDGVNVMVEYSASGRLRNGRDYSNDYVMAITVKSGQILSQRAYTDTLHLSRLFGPETS